MKAEVLLLLGCCFAAQAARANLNRAIPANVELLTACAMGVKTILPGPHSFTTHLIKQLKTSLKNTGSARISDIANMLVRRDSGYRYTPVHFSGLRDGKLSICLEPFNQDTGDHMYAKREAAWLTLKVSLRHMFTDPLVSDIIQWLRARPKRKVSRLTVEDVVFSASAVHHFIHDDGRGATSGPKFERLSSSAKQDVLTEWTNFRTLLAVLAAQLRSTSDPNNDSAFGDKIATDRPGRVLHGPLSTLLELESNLISLQDVVQRSVMALPNLYENKEALLEAIEDMVMQDLGFVPLLNRRLKARFFINLDDTMRIDHDAKSTPDPSAKFQSLVKEELEGLGPVLVEYKDYEALRGQPHNLEQMERQAMILANLLQSPGPAGFQDLRCIRWFHEPEHRRFGLVFEYPRGYDDFQSLHDIIVTTGSSQRPTLGQRFSIVKDIGEAILRWHTSANWVHQGISSHNIYLFKPTNSANYDYSNPYLYGFDFSRPSNGISLNAYIGDFHLNVYRHPARQRAPTEYHTKKHDLYSYGVLLLEVGIWNPVTNCFNEKLKRTLQPYKIQEYIKFNASRRLGQSMGLAYERATTRCLNTEFGVELGDSVDSRLAKAFQELVLKEIDPGTKLD